MPSPPRGMAGTDGEPGGDVERPGDAGLPWYVKAAIVLVLLIVAFIVVIDVLELANAV